MSLPSRALIAVALTFSSQASAQEPGAWRLTEEVVIGGSASAPRLTRITGLAVGTDSSVYVLDSQIPGIQVYDRNGRFIRAIGSSGPGAERVARPQRLGRIGDTLWVQHAGYSFSLFSSSGTFHRSFSVRPTPPMTSAVSAPMALLADGTVLWWHQLLTMPRAIGVIDVRSPRVSFVRTNVGAMVGDTIASFADVFLGEAHATVYAKGVSQTPRHAVSPDGSRVIIADNRAVRYSAGASVPLTTWVPGGPPTMRRLPYVPVDGDSLFPNDMSPGLVDTRPKSPHTLVFTPEHRFLPPVSSLIAGRDGTVWLETWGRPVKWVVLDSDGAMIGRIELANGDRLLLADRTKIWVSRYRTDGSEAIVRLRVNDNRDGGR